MELKKILALAMVALMALPSLTMTVGAEDGADMAGAIERARLYLDKVRASAENLATEYPDNEMVQGYLNEIYGLLGSEILLETPGDVGVGNESRIIIPMPNGFTLGDLDNLSWSEFLIEGYPPHVDFILDLNENGIYDAQDDALVFEYAYNTLDHYAEAPMPYGALTSEWYQTFSDDDKGPAVIDNSSMAWATKGDSGPPPLGGNFFFHSLADWKVGVTYTAAGEPEKTINADSIILRLEIEVDNWVVQTEAYVDDIEINGVPYGQAKYYLDQASACLGEEDFNSAAKNLAAARNILGRVKGLLTSMAKVHRVTRIERFMEQVEHRIKGIVDKVERLRGRFGEGKANKANAAMGWALGNMPQLGANPSGNDVSDAIADLEDTIASINLALGTLDEALVGDTSNIMEAMDRLEAKIRVLNATSQRLSGKGYNTTTVNEDLENADLLLQGIIDLLDGGDMEGAESLLRQAGDLVSEASKNIQRIRNQNKESKGKGRR